MVTTLAVTGGWTKTARTRRDRSCRGCGTAFDALFVFSSPVFFFSRFERCLSLGVRFAAMFCIPTSGMLALAAIYPHLHTAM